jgi:23S rRNA maturation mini-RNase III
MGNLLLLSIATEAPSMEALGKRVQEQLRAEKQPASKEEILRKLTESFATVRKYLETARAGVLAREADFWGTPTTARAILGELNVHLAEHLGQAIAYSRMNGITPPWSEPR